MPQRKRSTKRAPRYVVSVPVSKDLHEAVMSAAEKEERAVAAWARRVFKEAVASGAR